MAVEVLQRGERSLGELANEVNREHAEVLRAGQSMLDHAIRAGAVLYEVRQRVGYGDWGDWVDANLSITVVPANTYIRVWRYREELPTDRSLSLVQAVKELRGLPPVTGKNWRFHPETEAKIETARYLREDEGLSYPRIAERLGVDSGRVWRWLNPEAAQKTARQQAWRHKQAMRALASAEHAQAAKKIKGPISEAYATVRKLAQSLDQAMSEALEGDNRERQASLRAAIRETYEAEDEIVRALRATDIERVSDG